MAWMRVRAAWVAWALGFALPAGCSGSGKNTAAVPKKKARLVMFAGSAGKPPTPEAAKRFIAFLASDEGREIYAKYGYAVEPPTPNK